MYTGVNCNPDCTDQSNTCSRTCDGRVFNWSVLNSSDPSGYTAYTKVCNLNPRCDGRPQGFKVTYINASNGYHEITCCEGPETSHPAMKAEVQGDVSAIYDYSMPVKIGKQTYIMHILVWK